MFCAQMDTAFDQNEGRGVLVTDQCELNVRIDPREVNTKFDPGSCCLPLVVVHFNQNLINSLWLIITRTTSKPQWVLSSAETTYLGNLGSCAHFFPLSFSHQNQSFQGFIKLWALWISLLWHFPCKFCAILQTEFCLHLTNEGQHKMNPYRLDLLTCLVSALTPSNKTCEICQECVRPAEPVSSYQSSPTDWFVYTNKISAAFDILHPGSLNKSDPKEDWKMNETSPVTFGHFGLFLCGCNSETINNWA